MSAMRCSICGRKIAVYIDEIGNRWLAHVFPVALHRAALPEGHPSAHPRSFVDRILPQGGGVR